MGERGEGGDRELAHGGTKGGATLAEDQPRKGEEVGRKDGRTLSVKLWKEGEVRKPVTVARRVAEEEEVSSSL